MTSANSQLILATTVASKAHQHQRRKDGTPYIGHPFRVAMRCHIHGLYVMIGAVLHDVVEDTRGTDYEITLADLRDLGFDMLVVDIVDRVTRREGETYTDFIERCRMHDLARLLKIEDIKDNLSDQSALEPEEAAFLTKRYEAALERLS